VFDLKVCQRVSIFRCSSSLKRIYINGIYTVETEEGEEVEGDQGVTDNQRRGHETDEVVEEGEGVEEGEEGEEEEGGGGGCEGRGEGGVVTQRGEEGGGHMLRWRRGRMKDLS
jgi:hypothetical protein